MVRTQKGSSFICTKFKADSFIRSIVGGHKISNLSHVTVAHPLMGRFMVHTQGGSVLHLRTKYEADSFIRSIVIRGLQNFKFRSRDRNHAHLGVVLWSIRREGPSSISVQNMKRIA